MYVNFRAIMSESDYGIRIGQQFWKFDQICSFPMNTEQNP